MSMFDKLANLVSRVRARLRKALDRLPPLDQVWRERDAYAQALIALGDDVAHWGPAQIADIEYVRWAARIAETAANASGNEKLIEVKDKVKRAWSAVGIADQAFDAWWDGIGRPFLDAYVREVQKRDAWMPA